MPKKSSLTPIDEMPQSPITWAAEKLKIIDKEARLVSLEANIGQMQLHNTINLQRAGGFPVRIVLLKPRQVGWSTWCEAEGFYEVYHIPNWTAMAVSKDDESTNEIFRITTLYNEQLPAKFRRRTDNTNRKEIVFSAPHRSRFLSVTAGSKGVGRSFRVQFLHASECAFWRNAEVQLGGLYQMIPYKPGTTVILESTGFGSAGAFYETFVEAVDRRKQAKAAGRSDDYSGFLPVFFPWYRFPEYQMAVPSWYEFKPDEEERELVRKYGLCPEQLYWRRLKIRELSKKGGRELFVREYPATWREAFQASGRSVFSTDVLAEYEKVCHSARFAVLVPRGRAAEPSNVDRSINCWQFFKLPVDGREYIIAIDTMEGRQADPDDPKSEFDFHGVQVLDRDGFELVAEYHGRGDQHDLGEQCLLAAKYYNDAWVAPEVPNGMVVLDVFKQAGWDRIYHRQAYDDREDVEDTDDLGWRTTSATRPKMVEDFKVAINNYDVKFWSPELLEEMRSFVYDKQGRPGHQAGKHDDLLFAAMIAWQVNLRLPRKAESYPTDTVFEPDDTREVKKEVIPVGGFDNWTPEDEEIEDFYY